MKSFRSLVLTLVVSILAFALIAANASAQLGNSGAPNKSDDKSEKKKEKEKKKVKSKSDDDDDDDDDDNSNNNSNSNKEKDDKDKRDKKSKNSVKVAAASEDDQTTSRSLSQSGARRAEAKEPVVASAPASAASLEMVTATVETDPVPSGGDAADDPAIWVNPKDPAQSTIIGTDKQGGLAVYDLSGKQIQYLRDGNMDNVDLRDGFKLGGQTVALVTASNRKDNSIAIYKINPQTRMLENAEARKVKHGLNVYGMCMYRSKTGKIYYIGTSKSGDVEQWELFDSNGKVDAKKVRNLKLGSTVEGCVADDELGRLYVAEEAVGIWKFGAEPEAGSNGTLVDKVGAGNLFADVEGLAIAYGKDGAGYLMVSSQGNHSYVVYRREGNNEFVKKFRIGNGGGVDGCEETDGIDVTTANLGPAFPNGVFVVQDGFNDKGNQNFKLVPLQAIVKL